MWHENGIEQAAHSHGSQILGLSPTGILLSRSGSNFLPLVSAVGNTPSAGTIAARHQPCEFHVHIYWSSFSTACCAWLACCNAAIPVDCSTLYWVIFATVLPMSAFMMPLSAP